MIREGYFVLDSQFNTHKGRKKGRAKGWAKDKGRKKGKANGWEMCSDGR